VINHYHETLAEALQGIELKFSGLDIEFKGTYDQCTFISLVSLSIIFIIDDDATYNCSGSIVQSRILKAQNHESLMGCFRGYLEDRILPDKFK